MSLQILPSGGDRLNPAESHSTRYPFAVAAKNYGKAVLSVFPLARMTNIPLKDSSGHKDATTDPKEIDRMIEKTPAANVGLATGQVSEVIVIDVDPDKGGEETLAALVAEFGPLPKTRTHRTPRDGRHYLYRLPKDAGPVKCSARDGLDVRGDGGYAAMPPSVRPQGRYTVENRVPMAVAPDWLIQWARGRSSLSQPREYRPAKRVDISGGEPIPEGQRNGALFFIALSIKDRGKNRDEVRDELLAINEQRCQPQLDTDEVERIVKSAMRYPIRSGNPSPETLEAIEKLEEEWWQRRWPGMGGKTDRDIFRVLIELAHRYGMIREDGSVEVSASVRSVALAAATTFETVSRRATKRLAEAGLIRKVDNGRGRSQAATWVLLPQASLPVNTQHLSPPREEKVLCVDAQLRSRLWDLETPCFRWSGHVKKGRAGVLYVLEAHGPMSLERLAELMGWGNHRELRRRYLVPLEEQGLIECRGVEYALPDGYGERVEEIRGAPYTTIRRRRRKTQDGERTISWVQETEHTTSEVESYEAARRKYADQSRDFKLYLKSCSPEADDEIRELLNAWDDERDGLVVEFTGCNSEPDQEVVA